jgi:DNA primase
MDEQQLRAVLARISIVKVIGAFVDVKRDARGYYGSCPFCVEAGFMRVSARNQLFYCFCCHESGTALRFVMVKEHLSAEDALEWLERRGDG